GGDSQNHRHGSSFAQELYRWIDFFVASPAPIGATSPHGNSRNSLVRRCESAMKTGALLGAAIFVTAIRQPVAWYAEDANAAQPMTSTGVRVPFLHSFPLGQIFGRSELASLEQADGWLNSPPLTASALRGKVVLIDFWTYTCNNWRRPLPYLRAWDDKYRNQG